MVFVQLFWLRPTILYKACKHAFLEDVDGENLDDIITKLRPKQTYGRLVCDANDRGIFVMLDNAMPSQLKVVFPYNVDFPQKGLSDVIALTREFLAA